MRPLSFEFSKWENWRVASSGIIVDGRNCVALDWSDAEKLERFYIDAERGHVIVRKESSTKNRISFRQDINYKSDKEFGWIPFSWSATLHRASDAQVQSAGRAVLLEFAFNTEIPDTELDFQLPEGTEVQDERSGERYIVRKDKTKRHITEDELKRKPTFDQLLNSESGQAGRVGLNPQSAVRRAMWAVAPLLAAAGIVCSVMSTRKRKLGL
jgi:hypothetical protein